MTDVRIVTVDVRSDDAELDRARDAQRRNDHRQLHAPGLRRLARQWSDHLYRRPSSHPVAARAARSSAMIQDRARELLRARRASRRHWPRCRTRCAATRRTRERACSCSSCCAVMGQWERRGHTARGRRRARRQDPRHGADVPRGPQVRGAARGRVRRAQVAAHLRRAGGMARAADRGAARRRARERARRPTSCAPGRSSSRRRAPAASTASASSGSRTPTRAWVRCARRSSTAATTGCRSRG